VLILLPLAYAQGYVQPVTGTFWNIHTLRFSIPDSPSWARDTIYQALDSWNKAESWFLQNYYPNQTSNEYLLTIAGINPAQVILRYVNDTGQPWTGLTQIPSSDEVRNETVLVVLSRVQSPEDLEPVIEHELGHVLGLDHTKISYDLMYPARDAYSGGTLTYPSTLNLYAVFLLAADCKFASGDTITLPPQIPYLEWYPNITAIISPIVGGTESPIIPAGCPKSSTEPIHELPFLLVSVGIIAIVATYSWRRRRSSRLH